MDTKLTLSVDKNIVIKAKEYAKSHKISLSGLIENYLSNLGTKTESVSEISPLVKSLSGVIKLDDNFDYKEALIDSLIDKYKLQKSFLIQSL